MKKKIIVLSAVFSLLFAGLVFGVETYTRTPPNYTIHNPVSFRYTGALDNPEVHSWKLTATDMSEVDFISECFITNDETFTDNFPLGEYKHITIETWTDAVCSVGWNDWGLEFDEGNPIFEIIPFNFIPIDSGLPMDMLAFAGILFTDLGSLITLAVGVPLGFVVIKKIIGLIRT